MDICKYCNSLVHYTLGWIGNDLGEVMHEECYQLSGEDNGIVKEIHSEDYL